jgi:hypothetical protein
MADRQIEILYEQLLEIQIEFPVAVLASYQGISDLDVTWDDTILPLINKILSSHSVRIKSAELTIIPASIGPAKKISYRLFLLAQPPVFDFNWLINSLTKAGYQRGLHLKEVTKAGGFKSHYDGRQGLK